MFKAFVTGCYKNLLRQKTVASITVLGLTLGLSVFIMLLIYVEDEYSWDSHWQHSGRVVRLLQTSFNAGNAQTFPGGPAVYAPQLLKDFSGQIEAGARRMYLREQYIELDGRSVPNSIQYVDPAFAEIFNYEVVQGDLRAALAAPGRVALTTEDAERLFGSVMVAGKTLTITGRDGIQREYEVTAVFRKPGEKTIVPATSFTLLYEGIETGTSERIATWAEASDYAQAYFLLQDPGRLNEINARLDAFVDRYMEGSADQLASAFTQLRLQELGSARFNPAMGEPGTDPQQLGVFTALAFLVLLISVANYLILATAQSVDRKREIGVKKAAGATNGELLRQFIGESLLYAVLALLLSLVVVELALPLFSSLANHQLELQLTDGATVLLLGPLAVVVGILGGVYPGLVLSRFRPERVLRSGDEHMLGGFLRLRRLLCGFQFSIAIGMMLATLVLYFQLEFLRDRDPGFRHDNIVSITGFNSGLGQPLTERLQQEVCALPYVGICTLASRWVNSTAGVHSTYTYTRRQNDESLLGLDGMGIGFNFFNLYQIPLLAGRSFDSLLDIRNPETRRFVDSSGADLVNRIVLNESAIKALNFASAEDAVGQLIYSRTNNDGTPTYQPQEIIGVAADNQLLSLRQKTAPLSYVLNIPQFSFFIQAQVLPERLENFRLETEAFWQRMGGQSMLYFQFAEDNVAAAFEQEELEGALLLGSAMLAILLSCLGLYGIVLFELRQRTKEIGIRKVLGSDVKSIVVLFSWQFSIPVLLAGVIALPIAGWAMLQWLQRFPYQIDALWLLPIGVVAGAVALIIAWLTVASTALRVALRKPVLALRYE